MCISYKSFLNKQNLIFRIEDDKLLENLVKESEKPVSKPKTILDDLDSELIYEKSEPISKKPKIKSIETLLPPKPKNEITTKEPEKSEMDTDNFNFDDFGADDFSDVPNLTEVTSNESTAPTSDKSSKNDNLNQYIGDVSNCEITLLKIKTRNFINIFFFL